MANVNKNLFMLVWYVEVVGIWTTMIKGYRYNPNNLACCQMVYGLDISSYFFMFSNFYLEVIFQQQPICFFNIPISLSTLPLIFGQLSKLEQPAKSSGNMTKFLRHLCICSQNQHLSLGPHWIPQNATIFHYSSSIFICFVSILI